MSPPRRDWSPGEILALTVLSGLAWAAVLGGVWIVGRVLLMTP